jgi:hypothetical protein
VDEADEDLGVVADRAGQPEKADHRVPGAPRLRLAVREEFVGQGQLGVELQGAAEGLVGPGQVLLGAVEVVPGEEAVAAAEARPGGSERRVLLHALAVELPGHRDVRPVAHDLVRAEVELVSAGALRRPPPPGLAAGERRRERLHDALELVLQAEDVAQGRLQGLRGDEGPVRRRHELGRGAELVARAEERAHEDPVHVGVGGQGPEVGGLGGEAGGGRARPYEEGREPGERRRDRVGEGEGEEVDLGVGPQQAEGEDHEAGQRPGHGGGARRAPRRDPFDLCRHLRSRGRAVGRALGERAAEHAVEGHDGRVAGESRRMLVEGRGEDLDDRRSAERGPARDRLVQDRGHGEEIRAGVHVAAEHLLRGHVPGGAHEEPGPRQLGAGLDRPRELRRQGPGEAEVEELHPVGRQEDVRGLEVAVDDPGRVQGLEGAEDAAGERGRLRRRKGPAAQPVGQGLSLQQLHGDEELAVVLADLVDLADVRVIDGGGGAGLAPEALARRLVGLRDGLDRDLAAQAEVLGREHDPHPALPEPAEDAVAAESARGERRIRGRRVPAEPAEQPAQHALA